MTSEVRYPQDNYNPPDETLYQRIAEDLTRQGFSIRPAALPAEVTDSLYRRVRQLHDAQFAPAGIGRGTDYLQTEFVRTNEIRWINGEAADERPWLEWTGGLQRYLNRHLFLGLFSFESHFAHYRPGDYYRRHTDAFRGDANRVLSVVAYLNSGWSTEDGGELVLYRNADDLTGIRVVPLFGTVAVFLSEEFPHEVLPAHRDRYAVPGWFRVNGSTTQRVDPPR